MQKITAALILILSLLSVSIGSCKNNEAPYEPPSVNNVTISSVTISTEGECEILANLEGKTIFNFNKKTGTCTY